MYRVKKRDGKITDFDIQKIINALRKAFDGSHRQYNDDIISWYKRILHPTNMSYITEEIKNYAELKDYKFEMGTTSRTKEQRAQAQAFAKEHKIKYTEPT